jgi:DNA repair exonuclease SbcCD ATPase subunit
MKCLLNLFKMIETEYDDNKFTLHNTSYNLISLNGEDRNMTDKEISKIVGTYENFINTSVLLQGNNKTFKDKTNVEKKQILSSILKIDQYFSQV